MNAYPFFCYYKIGTCPAVMQFQILFKLVISVYTTLIRTQKSRMGGFFYNIFKKNFGAFDDEHGFFPKGTFPLKQKRSKNHLFGPNNNTSSLN